MCNTYHLHVGCMYTRCKWKFSTNGHVMFLLSATKLRRLCFYTCRSVILFTGGSASVHAGIQPTRPGTPRPGTPSEQTPPTSRHPPDQAPQQEQTPLRSRHPLDQAPPRTRNPPGSRHTLPGPGTPQQRQLLLQMVCILLECILITFPF